MVLFGLSLVAASGAVPAQNSVPSIAVTIKPLHSLVSAVTRGVTEPVLLFDGYSSPHTAQLKPSTLRSLYQADVLVWVGAGIEGFLARVVSDLDEKIGVVTFADIDGIERLPFRADGHDGEHGHGAENHTLIPESSNPESNHSESNHSESNNPESNHPDVFDYHLWLDPDIAAQLVRYLASYLADLDSANADVYRQNAEQLLVEIQAVNQTLAGLFSDLNEVPYLVFHDSFQYLEHRYGLHRATVIAIQPEVQPGAQRLRQVQQQVKSAQISCLFAEPQFPARVVSMLQRDSSLEVATLDPLASRYDAGPDLYVRWLSDIGETMHACLAR